MQSTSQSRRDATASTLQLQSCDDQALYDFTMQAQDTPERLPELALSFLEQQTGAEESSFVISDEEGIWHVRHLLRVPNIMMSEYAKGYNRMDLFNPVNNERAREITRRLVHVEELGHTAYRKSDFYNGFMRPHYQYHQCVLRLYGGNRQCIGAIGIHAGGPGRGLSAETARAMEGLGAMLERQLEYYLRLQRLRHEVQLVKNMVQSMPFGMILCDYSFRSIRVNHAAEQWLGSLFGAGWSASALDRYLQKRLLPHYLKQPLLPYFPPELRDCCIQVRPVATCSDTGELCTYYALYIMEIFEQRSEDWKEAAQRCGLSPREAQVGALVLRGLNNDQIADRLGISAHTVRRHLEHVYAKLGVQCRSDLIARHWMLERNGDEEPTDAL